MLRFLLLVAVCASVHGYDRDALRKTPQCLRKFNEHAWSNGWYIQARLPSCSWSGSNEFTNYYQNAQLQQDGKSFVAEETWRNDACVTIGSRLTITGPGKFTVKDPMGNAWSGAMVVPSTDYKHYSISWGCTKPGPSGDCSHNEAWVSVKTRQPHPSPKVWKMIESELQRLWKMSLTDLVRVQHDNACHSAPAPFT